MRKVWIFDTTLRDGEQSPGASLNAVEKMEIAKQLARLKVDIIEAGFPASSQGDFQAVSDIAKEVGNYDNPPIICALARALPVDVAMAWESVKWAKKSMVHTFIGTSPVQVYDILRKNYNIVLKMAIEAVKAAKTNCHEVEFSAMDATGTDRKFLDEIIFACIEAGATVINIPDTRGQASFWDFVELIGHVISHVKNIEKARLSVHCHDDLGGATWNSLAAVREGVSQIECAINGMGERAGNTPLEEVVMAIRKIDLDVFTTVNPHELLKTSRLVSRLTGFSVPPNKSVVGINALSHSSGIHVDGEVKVRGSFGLIQPEDLGLDPKETEVFILTARSGRNGLKDRLSKLGYNLSPDQFEQVFVSFKNLADQKKQVFDEDLAAIVDEIALNVSETWRFDHVKYEGEGGSHSWTKVWVMGENGIQGDNSYGDGPVDAAYKAIDKITGINVDLLDYSLHAATKGQDAMGEVLVRVKDNGRIVIGRGASTDIIEASVKAYLNAINRILNLRAIESKKTLEGEGIPKTLKEFERMRSMAPYETK